MKFVSKWIFVPGSKCWLVQEKWLRTRAEDWTNPSTKRPTKSSARRQYSNLKYLIENMQKIRIKTCNILFMCNWIELFSIPIWFYNFHKSTRWDGFFVYETIEISNIQLISTCKKGNFGHICQTWIASNRNSIVKRVLAVLRSYINWSCISTWTQTSTVWTDIQIDGRHIDITQIHRIQIHRQTLHSLCRWWIRQLVLLNLFVWCSFVQRIF
jgi:hypothetical protein